MKTATYDIPSSILEERHSKAFQQFFHNWFEEPFGLIRHEVDTGFVDNLTLNERELAIDLLRRNLRLGHAHIIGGIALLDDKASIPILKGMFDETTDTSRKLTIAGSLWKLHKDPVFPLEIDRLVRRGRGIVKQAHFDQILWLGDERTISYLIDLLTDGDSFVSFLALSRLNEIEDNKRYLLSREAFPNQPDYYLGRRENAEFVESMVEKLNDYNPTEFVMETTSGIVSEAITTNH